MAAKRQNSSKVAIFATGIAIVECQRNGRSNIYSDSHLKEFAFKKAGNKLNGFFFRYYKNCFFFLVDEDN